MLQSKVTGTIEATQRIHPRLGFFSAKYANPKYPIYKMSSCSTWLLHAVLEQMSTFTFGFVIFFSCQTLVTQQKSKKVTALLHLLGSSAS